MKLTCKEASRLLSKRLDGDLGLADRTALRLHLALCDACTRLTTQFEFLRKALRTYGDDRDDRDQPGPGERR